MEPRRKRSASGFAGRPFSSTTAEEDIDGVSTTLHGAQELLNIFFQPCFVRLTLLEKRRFGVGAARTRKPLKNRPAACGSRNFPQAFIKHKSHNLLYTKLAGLSSLKPKPKLELE